jgi:ABC-type dipeptide/oligopeptide/nickel transport system permease subunit
VTLLRRGAICLLSLVALAAVAPEWWAPAAYDQQFRESPDAAPSRRFLLGTDAVGRDRFSRLLYGTRVSLLLAPAAALLSCVTAALLGGIAGFAGGPVDRVIIGAVDLCLSLPWLLFLLIVRACLPLNLSPALSVTVTFLLLGVLGWAAPARVVRAGVRNLKNSDFVFHAHALGVSPGRLLTRQLLPNVAPVLFAQFWIAVPVYILAETTLGMLGLGIAGPLPSWGGLLRELEGSIGFPPIWLLAPAVLLTAVVGCFELVVVREDSSL